MITHFILPLNEPVEIVEDMSDESAIAYALKEYPDWVNMTLGLGGPPAIRIIKAGGDLKIRAEKAKTKKVQGEEK